MVNGEEERLDISDDTRKKLFIDFFFIFLHLRASGQGQKQEKKKSPLELPPPIDQKEISKEWPI